MRHLLPLLAGLGCAPADRASSSELKWTPALAEDSGEPSEESPSTGPGLVGPIEGVSETRFYVLSCLVTATLTGERCEGCGLAWNVELRPVDPSTCDDPRVRTGVFAVRREAVYFKGSYWGAATHGGGTISWESVGYVDGAESGAQTTWGLAYY